MNDRELLELAARAGKIEGEWCEFHDAADGGIAIGIGNPRVFAKGDALWNPLTNDGDALRLAVKIRMDVEQSVPQDQDRWVCASVAESDIEGSTECFEDEAQRLTATRRAIVRAAASIGKSMP
ncbi:hypothetical protein [Pseudomonas sp. I2]|uniref:hypothetical protein n=1 Tax=Pseudomonas sp. I2 TaxID=1338438 RepID=UPI0034D42F89